MPFLGVNEILQKVLNASEDRLKVDINATVTAGAVEVAIDQTTDSIKIGDGTDLMAVNADGSINVVVSGGGGSTTVSGTVSVNSITGTVVLPTGASTAARQDTGNASLASIDGKITACDTGAVVVSSSALPSGAATAANQATEIASLASIDTKTPVLGQAVMASSTPVVIASNQSTLQTALYDGSGNALASATTTPGGSDRALVVRNIPSGTQTISGTITTSIPTASSPSVSRVAVSASSVTLLAANPNRLCSPSFQNTSTTRFLYLTLGSGTATTSPCTAILAPASSTVPGGYYEPPGPAIYTGAVVGIWSGTDASGYCHVTEVTA